MSATAPTLLEPRQVRWTRDEYYWMADAGLFRDRRVELVDGEILEMAAQRHEHAVAIELLDDALRALFPAGYRIRIQLPLHLGDASEPEPDGAVVPGSPRGSRDHPSTAVLVVEVADTTLEFDRRRKLPRYAEAGIPEYWIVNLVARCLEVYRTPVRDSAGASPFRYADARVLLVGDKLAPLAAPDSEVAVADLLP